MLYWDLEIWLLDNEFSSKFFAIFPPCISKSFLSNFFRRANVNILK